MIEKLLGHRLPGTGDLYIHDWDSRLRDAVTRLAVLTEQKLREKISAKKHEKAFRVPLEVPPFYVELFQNRVSSGKMVPRDRIELSTPAFSGLNRNHYYQYVMRITKVKQRQMASCEIKGLQGGWAVGLKGEAMKNFLIPASHHLVHHP